MNAPHHSNEETSFVSADAPPIICAASAKAEGSSDRIWRALRGLSESRSPRLTPASERTTTVAITASFDPAGGVLSAIGDNNNGSITFSRDPAGNLLVNAGAVQVVGGTPTIPNTSLIQAFG